jgi:hypothetical protein
MFEDVRGRRDPLSELSQDPDEGDLGFGLCNQSVEVVERGDDIVDQLWVLLQQD